MNNMVRLLVLVGVTACGVVLVMLGLARHDADLTAPANMLLLVFAVLVYLLPTGLALYRDCKSTAAIVMVNLFLGWTILGWFAAMGWAAGGKVREQGRPIGKSSTHPVPGH